MEAEKRSDEGECELVLQARNGDRKAFGILVQRYMRRAYFAALGLVGSHEDAEDLSQEAFARVYRLHESIDPKRPFYGLVYQVLRRLCFNHLRDTKTRKRRLDEQASWLTVDAESAAHDANPARAAELYELRVRLSGAIERLSDKEREVFVLKEYDGLKYREIGDLLGIPIGTVMSRLYSARKSLAGVLGENR